MGKKLRDIMSKKGLNHIFLVGEIVDVGVMPRGKKTIMRARLKVRPSGNKTTFVYIDIYSKPSQYQIMVLVCQTGNIVYVEGEFRNMSIDSRTVKPYVLVNHIECLLRRRDVPYPDTSIIGVLDELDPIGYAPDTAMKTKGGKRNG